MSAEKNNGVEVVKYPRAIHVGSPRCKTLTECAIDVSHYLRRQYTAGQFNQFLIDNFAEQAKQMLKEQSTK